MTTPAATPKKSNKAELAMIAGFGLFWLTAWAYFAHAFTYAYFNAKASPETLKTATVKVDQVKTITRTKSTSSSTNYYFTVTGELAGREFYVPGEAKGAYGVSSLSGQEVTIQYAPYNGFGVFDSTVYSIKGPTELFAIESVKKAEAEANPLWINGGLFLVFLYFHVSVLKDAIERKKQTPGA